MTGAGNLRLALLGGSAMALSAAILSQRLVPKSPIAQIQREPR